MSDLRDARLKKALDQAPDGDARPADAVREAILHKARLTAAASAPPPRRAAWLAGFGRPWNSALATMGVVAFVGVLIWNQGLLQQHPEEPAPVAGPKPAPAPAASVAIVPEAPLPEVKSMLQERKRAAAPKAAAPAPPLVPVPVPPSTVSARAESMPSQDRATPAPSPAYAPPQAPAPAPVAAARAAREPRFDVTVSGSAVVQSWTALRLSGPGGPVLVPRDQLPAGVAELLAKALRTPARDEAASGALAQGLSDSAALRVELLLGEHLVGQLEFSAGELRWTPAGQSTRILRPGDLAELRKALEAAVPTK